MGDILHGTIKWFAKEKGYGVLKPYKDSEMTGDIFVHKSDIIHSNDDEDKNHLNSGDAVEFRVYYNGRKDRNEAKDVNRITRKQLKSKKQLEVKYKREQEKLLRRIEKEREEARRAHKKHQDKLDKHVKERVSRMQFKTHVEFSESDRYYNVCTPNCGDYLPMLLYNSGYYLTCDLCGKKEDIKPSKKNQIPVIKKKSEETQRFWGFLSYETNIYFLTDGEQEVKVDIHKIKRPFGRIGCDHEFAELSSVEAISK